MKTLLCFVLGAALVAAGCSHAASNDATDADSGVASPPSAPTDDHDAGPPEDAASTDGSASGASAAATAARTDPLCTALGPFYWEIGDVNGVLASGSIGTGYGATTSLEIASASKLVFGTYVVERMKNSLAAIDMKALTMRSGRTNFENTCDTALTVNQCCNKARATGGTNCELEAGEVDHFNYGGGHFEQYGIDLGLGASTKAQLASEVAKYLGSDLEIDFANVMLANGVETTPAHYGQFLRKILGGKLAITAHLGERSVCTLPGPSCPTAHSSPVPEAWQYSYGHWVETDGSFSSPGLYGFYPWIDATKTHYGLVARKANDHLSGPAADTSYWHSVECGRVVRNAFLGK
jgi:hypothetical protein